MFFVNAHIFQHMESARRCLMRLSVWGARVERVRITQTGALVQLGAPLEFKDPEPVQEREGFCLISVEDCQVVWKRIEEESTDD